MGNAAERANSAESAIDAQGREPLVTGSSYDRIRRLEIDLERLRAVVLDNIGCGSDFKHWNKNHTWRLAICMKGQLCPRCRILEAAAT